MRNLLLIPSLLEDFLIFEDFRDQRGSLYYYVPSCSKEYLDRSVCDERFLYILSICVFLVNIIEKRDEWDPKRYSRYANGIFRGK